MKIAFLSPHLRNAGGIKILLTYAELLRARGHDVTVYTLSSNVLRRTIANWIQIGRPTWLPYAVRTKRVAAWPSIDFAAYDQVIAGGYKNALALADSGIPHGWWLVQHDEGLYHGPRDAVDEALNSPLKKIVVSTWLQEVVTKRAGQSSALLLNPLDRRQFFVPESIKKPEGDTVRILILDHSFEWKGTAEGIALVQTLKKAYPQVRLIGLGRRRAEAAAQYDEYHFDPPQDTIRDIYAGVDIFLCMSWDEGFGLPSLEAMASGTMVVTYDNGGSRDFAHDGVTALVAPRKNEAILKEKLVTAITDANLRHQIATAGTAFAEALPTWEEQAGVLESLLTKDHS